MKSYIIVRTQIEGIHYYADAPQEVYFLKYPHRHMVHVELEIQVYHGGRELEFIMVQRWLNKFLQKLNLMDTPMSCEMIAEKIILEAQSKYGRDREITCKVFEDNENGAKVVYK